MARAGDTAPLAMRLSLAFVAVALSAVALLSVLTAVFADNDVSQLSRAQRDQVTQAMASVVGAAQGQAGSWQTTDFRSAQDLARRIKADVRVTDEHGRVVLISPGFDREHGPIDYYRVQYSGQRVGRVAVRFRAALDSADIRLRAEFWRAIAGAAGLAALLALVVAIAVSRRLARPVVRLIEVANRVGSGDRSARAGSIRGPTELVDLAATFDEMADALDRQEQLRRYLVADVAHELRTPVSVLLAGHEALLDGVLEASPASLGSLRDEVLRLARMVDDLQNLAAAEAAALQLTVRPGDLAAMAAAAADSLAGHFEASQIQLDRDLAPAPVRADERWMHQVITNLLGNAVKFTPAGGQVVVATAVTGGRATLSVTDNGAGIAADQIPHIFERFYRGANPTGAAGSGVGLAVVAELVRGHDGAVQVDSEPGRGTRFVVSLPLA